jgi:hypothetical protein
MAEIKKQPQQQTQPVKQTAPTKPAAAVKKQAPPAPALFTKDNYKWMAIGGAIMILGLFLLSGGKNQDPNTFDPKVVYSTTRITIAPILIVAGLLVEIYAIFRKTKPESNV